MNFISETINSSELVSVINIPNELLNQEVEIVLIPKKSTKSNTTESKSMYGILNKFANSELRKLEKDAWLNAVRKSNGNS